MPSFTGCALKPPSTATNTALLPSTFCTASAGTLSEPSWPSVTTTAETGDPAGRFLARQVGISGFKTVLRFNQAELFLALNKEVPDEVVAKLQKALDQLRAEGVVDKISDKYL